MELNEMIALMAASMLKVKTIETTACALVARLRDKELE